MRKWILVFGILCMVCSCKSKQKLAAEFREQESRIEQVEAVGNEQVKRDSVGQKVQEVVSRREDDLETETVVKVTEYDTSKPLVEGTGRPPVVRETETIKKQRRGVREETTGNISENSKVAYMDEKQWVVTGKNEVQQELNGKVEQRKVRKSGVSLWSWLGIAGIIAVLGYVYLQKRR